MILAANTKLAFRDDLSLPTVINRKMPVNKHSTGFVFSSFDPWKNIIYNFVPIWQGDPIPESRLYKSSVNYDTVSYSIKEHALQNWDNSRIKILYGSPSWKDYLLFSTLDEISAYAREIYTAYENYFQNCKDQRYLLNLPDVSREILDGKKDSILCNGKHIFTAAKRAVLTNLSNEKIYKSVLRDIRKDCEIYPNNNKFKQDILTERNGFNGHLIEDVWYRIGKIQIREDIFDISDFYPGTVANWVDKVLATQEFLDSVRKTLARV